MNRMLLRLVVWTWLAGFGVAGISAPPADAAAPVEPPAERLVCDVLKDWIAQADALNCPAPITAIRVPVQKDRKRMITAVRRALHGYSLIWVWGPEDRLLAVKYLGQDLISPAPQHANTGNRQKAQVLRALKNLTTPQLLALARAPSIKPLPGEVYDNPAFRDLFRVAQIQSPGDWPGQSALRIKRWVKKVFQDRKG